MSQKAHENEGLSSEQKQSISTKKLEDRIDALNEENNKNAATRKKDAQDKQQQQHEND